MTDEEKRVFDAAKAYREAHRPPYGISADAARVALFAAVDALPSTSDVPPPSAVGENPGHGAPATSGINTTVGETK